MSADAASAPYRQRPCTHVTGTVVCGITPTNRYLVGDRCCEHTPSAVAGHPEAIPDPARTLDGIRTRIAESSDIVISVGGRRV